MLNRQSRVRPYFARRKHLKKLVLGVIDTLNFSGESFLNVKGLTEAINKYVAHSEDKLLKKPASEQEINNVIDQLYCQRRLVPDMSHCYDYIIAINCDTAADLLEQFITTYYPFVYMYITSKQDALNELSLLEPKTKLAVCSIVGNYKDNVNDIEEVFGKF